MIKAIIFDLGRVLIDINFTQGLGGIIDSGKLDIIRTLGQDGDFIDFSTGRISSLVFYDKITKKLDIDISYPTFVKLWCSIFSELTGMQSIVRKLGESYPLGLLSDTDTLHWNYIIERFPWIRSCFHHPVLSFETGVMKPDSLAFASAARFVGAEPDECLFIDDLQKNIDGAREFGMHGVQFLGVEDLLGKLGALGILLS